jgi:hypothetical protein
MIVIFKARSWELIDAPQDIEEAWELADLLTTSTGVNHYVGRA